MGARARSGLPTSRPGHRARGGLRQAGTKGLRALGPAHSRDALGAAWWRGGGRRSDRPPRPSRPRRPGPPGSRAWTPQSSNPHLLLSSRVARSASQRAPPPVRQTRSVPLTGAVRACAAGQCFEAQGGSPPECRVLCCPSDAMHVPGALWDPPQSAYQALRSWHERGDNRGQRAGAIVRETLRC